MSNFHAQGYKGTELLMECSLSMYRYR